VKAYVALGQKSLEILVSGYWQNANRFPYLKAAASKLGMCWVSVAVSKWNISILENTAKKWLQWLRKRVKKKTLKFSVIYCGQVWIGETRGN